MNTKLKKYFITNAKGEYWTTQNMFGMDPRLIATFDSDDQALDYVLEQIDPTYFQTQTSEIKYFIKPTKY